MEDYKNMIKNVYKQSAEDGMLFGALLSAVSLAFIYSDKAALLSLLALLLLFAMPGVLYVLQRRYFRRTGCIADFSTLWMLGLMISLFGSLICGIVTYAWLQFVEPTFIFDQAQAAVDAYKAVPELRDSDIAVALQRAIDEGMLPTAIEFVVNMILLTTFIGSLTALVASLIVRARGGKPGGTAKM